MDTKEEDATVMIGRFVQGENSSKSGNRQQSDYKGKGPSADVNMVFMLPMEFLAPSNNDEEIISLIRWLCWRLIR
jgi:hypothetical protein